MLLVVLGGAVLSQLPVMASLTTSGGTGAPVAATPQPTTPQPTTPQPTPAQSAPAHLPAASPAPTPGPGASGAAGALSRGEQLYGSGCAGCHGQAGEGSGRGPDLRGVGPASVDFQLRTGRMPLGDVVDQPLSGPPAYSSSDIDALVRYVSGLGAGGEAIPSLAPGDLRSGRSLYLANCASCHSSTGVGAVLPAGHVAPSLVDTPATQVAEAVRVGPGLMPRFPASALSDRQLDDLVTYVRSLSRNEDHGGWSIGGVGPVTEGLVGWVLGLGTLVVVIRLLGKRAS